MSTVTSQARDQGQWPRQALTSPNQVPQRWLLSPSPKHMPYPLRVPAQFGHLLLGMSSAAGPGPRCSIWRAEQRSDDVCLSAMSSLVEGNPSWALRAGVGKRGMGLF